MGSVLSYIIPGNTGRTDDPDPITGLTSREKYLVRNSWTKLMKSPTDSGVTLLTLYFKKYPDYVQLFPFKNVPQEEFSTNQRFRAHANSVVYALAAIVDSINDNDLLVPLLFKTGTSHKPRNVTANAFKELFEVAIDLFSTFMKHDEVEAWRKTLQAASAVILQGLEKGE